MAIVEVLSPRTRGAGRYVTAPLELPTCNTVVVRIARDTAWRDRDLKRIGKAVVCELSDGSQGFEFQANEAEELRIGLLGLIDGRWEPLGAAGYFADRRFTALGDFIDESLLIQTLHRSVSRVKVIVDLFAALSTQIAVEPLTLRLATVKLRDEHHSIAVEDAQTGTATSGASSVSTASLTPAGDDRYLAIIGGNGQYPTAAAYTSMSFGATTATQRGSVNIGFRRISAAALTAPATTPAVCSYVVANADERMGVAGIAFSGVDQATSHDDPVTATGTSTTPEVTVTAGDTGDVRVGGAFSFDGVSTIATGANETQRAAVSWGGNAVIAASTKEDGGSDAMNWTLNASVPWAAIGWNINMAEEGGGGSFQAAWALGSNVVIGSGH